MGFIRMVIIAVLRILIRILTLRRTVRMIRVLFKRRRIQERAATPPSVISFGSNCVESGVYCVHHSTLKKMTYDRSHDNAEQDMNQMFCAHSPLGPCAAPAGRGMEPSKAVDDCSSTGAAAFAEAVRESGADNYVPAAVLQRLRRCHLERAGFAAPRELPPVEHYAPLPAGNWPVVTKRVARFAGRVLDPR